MARKGNQQKNGLDRSTSNHKKGSLQSDSAMPNKKGKRNGSNMKVIKEEFTTETQPSISVTLTEPEHVKDEKKRTNKSGKHTKVEVQSAEQSEPRVAACEDYLVNMSTTGGPCFEEENISGSKKNRKRNPGYSLNGFDQELPETLGVRYLKTFVSSVLHASTEWLDRHKPLLDILVIKILISRDYVRMKIKYAYPIVLKWLAHFTSMLLVLLMVWLDCTLRGVDSVMCMGTTSFFTVIWCTIFSVAAMIGMLKFVTFGAIVALVALFIGFTIGLLLLAFSGIIFLWLYGCFWTTLIVLIFGGLAFTFSHERFSLLIMTVYSVYCAWTLVGWLGIVLALNLSFFSSDALMFFLKNNISEQRRPNNVPEPTAGMQSGPGVFNGEQAHTDGGTNPPADRGSGVPSTSGSDADLTSEDEVVRLLNSADHYSALGLSRFQEIDASFLKREYRKKAMLVHPDKNMGNEKAADAFKKLQNAYEVLLDTSKQKTYDDELRREDLLNYFRRFQNDTPKNKRHGFFGSTFGHMEVNVNDPLGESRRIACQKCGSFHMWFYTRKTKSRARSCQDCKDFHAAKDGDGWVEQSSQPLLYGLFQKVDLPRAYICADSKIYDATEWYICQGYFLASIFGVGANRAAIAASFRNWACFIMFSPIGAILDDGMKGMRCPSNTHRPSFHVNTSVMSKHSSNGKGSSSSQHRGAMPNMDETMSEEEFMEWLQNAVQSGMFDNFSANQDVSSKTGTTSNGGSSGKRKKKGKKW